MVSTSNVGRPYVISVEADIPVEAIVKIVVSGTVAFGMPWRREYINPQRKPLVTPVYDNLAIELSPAPNSLAVPFLYAIVVEGDNQKWVYEVAGLVPDQEMSRLGWSLTKPLEGRPFLTNVMFLGARVSASTVDRPWLFEIDGYAAPEAELKIPISGVGPDGSRWEREFIAPCHKPLPETIHPHFQIGLSMRATPDGMHSPSLNGIAFEGDGRRFYIPAAAFADGLDMNGLRLSRYPDGTSMLMIQWIEPKFAGQPPSIIGRLNDLFAKGKLQPGVSYFDE